MNFLRDASVFALRGKDARDLVQRLTTNDVLNAPVGRWVGNVFTTEKGRLLALTSMRIEADGLLVVVAGPSQPLLSYLDDMTFREDVTAEPMPGCSVVSSFAGEDELLLVKGTHAIGEEVVADGSADVFDAWRIKAGIPVWGRELTPERNPHEARLGAFIDWKKGCYVGQEVVARLDTYKKVQRHLTKFACSEVGTLLLDGKEVGEVTSARDGFGLGYVKEEAAEYTLGGGVARVLPW